MNACLRNRLSALALVTGALSLGLALGGPARPGLLANDPGHRADAAIAPPDTASPTADDAPRYDRRHLALPFFSFGPRAGRGVP